MQKLLGQLEQNKTNQENFSFRLDPKILIASLTVVTLNFSLGQISIFLSFQNGVSAISPVAGLSLASLLLLGPRILPACILGEFLVNVTSAYPQDFLTSGLIALGDGADSLAASFLINHFVKHRNLLDRSQDVFRFLLLQIPTPLISSTLAATALCQRGISPWSAYPEVWRSWFTGIITGTLIVTPAILAWAQKFKQSEKLRPQQIAEFAILLLLLVIITRIAFWQH